MAVVFATAHSQFPKAASTDLDGIYDAQGGAPLFKADHLRAAPVGKGERSGNIFLEWEAWDQEYVSRTLTTHDVAAGMDIIDIQIRFYFSAFTMGSGVRYEILGTSGLKLEIKVGSTTSLGTLTHIGAGNFPTTQSGTADAFSANKMYVLRLWYNKNSGPAGVAQFECWLDGSSEFAQDGSAAGGTANVVKVGGTVNQQKNDAGITVGKLDYTAVADSKELDPKLRICKWADRPGLGDLVLAAATSLGYLSKCMSTHTPENLPATHDDFAAAASLGDDVYDKWVAPSDVDHSGTQQHVDTTQEVNAEQQTWGVRPDLTVKDDPTLLFITLAVGCDVKVNAGGDNMAPVEGLIHDGTNEAPFGSVYWCRQSVGGVTMTGFHLGVWTKQADGTSAWTWDALRDNHVFGVEYDPAAGGDPGGQLGGLEVWGIGIEVGYVDDWAYTSDTANVPKPPRTRRPLPTPS